MPGRGQGLPWTHAPLAAQPHGQGHESSTATPFTTMDCGHRCVCLALLATLPRTVTTPCERDVVARCRMTPKEKLPLGCCLATTVGRRRPWPLRARHATQAATLPWTDLATPAAFLRPASAPPLGLRGARPALIWPEAAGRRRSRRPSHVGDRVRGRSAGRHAWEREGWPSAARGGRLGGEERNETLSG